MVPSSLIMLPLVIAFFPSSFAYLFGWPQRRLANWYFAQLAGCSGGMMFALTLMIFSVRIVWLSWVMFAFAMAMVPCSVMALRSGHGAMRAREAEVARQRARGR